MGAAAFAAIAVLAAGGMLARDRLRRQTEAARRRSAAEQLQREQGVVLDRVVAVVNGEVILESDVDEERRFEAFQPYRERKPSSTRDEMIERLIDRTLILQQAALQPEDAVPDEELDAQLATLRKDIPACKQYHCETEEGWERFLNDHGFTEEELRERWRKRMEVLRFIEVRFRTASRFRTRRSRLLREDDAAGV